MARVSGSASGRQLVFGTAVLLTAALNTAFAGDQPIGANDIVVGYSNGYTGTSFATTAWTKWYNASTNTWKIGPGPDNPEPGYAPAAASWDREYVQAIEFDNFGARSHAAQGNLLAANFGSAWTGFGIYDFATDGTDQAAGAGGLAPAATDNGIWSIKNLTGAPSGFAATYTVNRTNGAQATFNGTERGGNTAISPMNNRVAWSGYDSGVIFAMDYDAGTNPTAAGGITLSGTRVTAKGDRNGNIGTGQALAATTTTGLTWMNNNILWSFDKLGKLVEWNVGNAPAGNDNGANPLVSSVVKGSNSKDTFRPTPDASWRQIAALPTPQNFQYTDIEYNPSIDPHHVYAGATINGSFTGKLYRWDFDPTTGALTNLKDYTLTNATLEPREIGFDANGNLFWSNYAGSGNDVIVGRLLDADDDATWASSAALNAKASSFHIDGEYTAFNGLDVANDVLMDALVGNFNGDTVVDNADFTVWAANFGWTGYYNPADANADGLVDNADFTVWAGNTGFTFSSLMFDELRLSALDAGVPQFQVDRALSSVIPEPAAFGALALGAVAGLARRRRA